MNQGQSGQLGESTQQGNLLASIPARMLAVIIKPAGFFSDMPRQGGYLEPLLFMVVMAALAALVMTVTGLVGFGPMGMMAMGVTGLIVLPVMAAVFGFVGAAIVFVIWKLMGSQERFETAYRCVAFSYAYAPVAALIGGVPYAGTLVNTLWPMALLAIASVHVHGRSSGVFWAVFGILGLILALMGLGAEYTGRQAASGLEGWSKQMEKKYGKPEEMTPEQAGEMLGDFLKGMQKGGE